MPFPLNSTTSPHLSSPQHPQPLQAPICQWLAHHADPSSSLISLAAVLCYFCGGGGHLEKDCHKKKEASEKAKKITAERKERGRQSHGRNHSAHETSSPVMQVLSHPLTGLHGSRLMQQLTGTQTQV